MLKKIYILLVITTILSLGSFKYVIAADAGGNGGADSSVGTGDLGPGTMDESGATGGATAGSTTDNGATAGGEGGSGPTAGGEGGSAPTAGGEGGTVDSSLDPEHQSGTVGTGKYQYNVQCKCGPLSQFLNPICKLICEATKSLVAIAGWIASLIGNLGQ